MFLLGVCCLRGECFVKRDESNFEGVHFLNAFLIRGVWEEGERD